MNTSGVYQPDETTTVVVINNRVTAQQARAIQKRGCVVSLGALGGFLVFTGIILITNAFADSMRTVGIINLSFGLILGAAAVGVYVSARRKYKQFLENGGTSPGLVTNPPPPGSQGTQPLSAGYLGQPQIVVYPVQPEPAGYPAQEPVNSAPTSTFPDPPPAYPEPSGGYAVQADPPYPQKTSVTSKCDPQAHTASDASSQPPPYQP